MRPGINAVTVVQQVRHISRRKIAYPTYPFKKLARENPKKHDSNLKSAMRQFLGPKNYKGEYALNKYNQIPTNHVPNYVKPDLERGQTVINPNTGEPLELTYNGTYQVTQRERRLDNVPIRRQLQPFPNNPFCKTNYVVSDELKSQIYDDIQNKGLSTQQVSQNYGLKIPRVEAIVKLFEIEKKWEQRNMINDNLARMAKTVYQMLPVFEPDKTFARENLSEIPVPPKTLNSRFLTIAESEPFGPIDAAEVLELEPAVKTLEQLSTTGEHSQGNKSRSNSKKTSVTYGELRKGERSVFKFVDTRAEEVAHRYGSGNRDNKKDRRIAFNERGQMVYA